MSLIPGRAPPMFIMTSRTALPMEALARWPGPNAPHPEAIAPHATRAGPLTMSSGAMQWVVACSSVMSISGRQIALTAAITTGM